MTPIASRILSLTSSQGDRSVELRIFAPTQDPDGGWNCSYEIDWPGAPRSYFGAGVDSMQALIIALQMMGAELYASNAHKEGRLSFEQPGSGYGMPVPAIIRSALIGDDAKHL